VGGPRPGALGRHAGQAVGIKKTVGWRGAIEKGLYAKQEGGEGGGCVARKTNYVKQKRKQGSGRGGRATLWGARGGGGRRTGALNSI